MNHLKKFENFNSIEELKIRLLESIQPDIEDAKWIVISHLGEIEKIDIDDKIMRFRLLENPSNELIQNCKRHLGDSGFSLICSIRENKYTVFDGNSPEEYLRYWLNSNFGDLKQIAKAKEIYYVDKDNLPLFFYHQNLEFCYINYNRIWLFFIEYFYLDPEINNEKKQIKTIIKDWLKETYNLTGLAPCSDDGYFMIDWNKPIIQW